MQIQIYKETYHQPVSHIDVPKDLQNQAFEVLFMPLSKSNNAPPKKINQPNPALKGLMTLNDDLIQPTTDSQDWELD